MLICFAPSPQNKRQNVASQRVVQAQKNVKNVQPSSPRTSSHHNNTNPQKIAPCNLLIDAQGKTSHIEIIKGAQ
jgi:hypothetical protein